MATWTNGTKTSSVFSQVARATTAFMTYLRHGKEPLVGLIDGTSDIGNRTFEDISFYNDSRTMEELTLEELADQEYTNQTKN